MRLYTGCQRKDIAASGVLRGITDVILLERRRRGVGRDHMALRSLEMADQPAAEPTQQTKPVTGEGIAIPIPKKADVIGFLEKIAGTSDPDKPDAVSGGSRR